MRRRPQRRFPSSGSRCARRRSAGTRRAGRLRVGRRPGSPSGTSLPGGPAAPAAARATGLPPGAIGRGAGGGAPGAGANFAGASVSSALVKYLEAHQGTARYMVAAVGSNTAGAIALESGRNVIDMGGFMGADPAPTLAQVEHLIDTGQLHYILLGGQGGGPGGGAGGPAAIAPAARPSKPATSGSRATAPRSMCRGRAPPAQAPRSTTSPTRGALSQLSASLSRPRQRTIPIASATVAVFSDHAEELVASGDALRWIDSGGDDGGRGAGGSKLYAYQGCLACGGDLAGEIDRRRDLRGGHPTGLEEAPNLDSGQRSGVHLQLLQVGATGTGCR